MKSFAFIAVLVLLVVFITPTFANAQEPVDDRIVVKKSDLPPDLVKQIEMKNQIQGYGEWVGRGKEVGVAIDEGLGAVKKHALEISETRLGIYIMFLIGWAVMGRDMLQLVIGIPLLFIGTIVFIITWFTNCRTRKYKSHLDDNKNWVYKIHEPDGAYQFCVFGLYVVYILICMAIAIA